MKMKFIGLVVWMGLCCVRINARVLTTTGADGTAEPGFLALTTSYPDLTTLEVSGDDSSESGSGSDAGLLITTGSVHASTAAPNQDLTTVEGSGDDSSESRSGRSAGLFITTGSVHASTAAPNQGPPPITESYHVISKVTARYASTSVLVTVNNTANHSQEVPFSFKISEEAFISSYVMTIDGIPYVAEVREKAASQKAYNQARNEGRDASQVKQKEEDPTRFLVDLNLAAESVVVFNLTYQEVLRRDKGQFKHLMNIAPGQIVDDLQVEVNVLEPQGITFIDSQWTPRLVNLQPTVSFYPPSPQANVLFRPSRALQSQGSPELGIAGVLEVTYDVQHDFSGGDIQIANGYFVHYISPEGLPPAPKKVVFVLDVSGSMGWPMQKINQLQSVMIEILGQLRDIDLFNVMSFSTGVQYWQEEVVPATRENIEQAKLFVGALNPGGGTYIYGALLAAIEQFNDTEEAFPAIFFLTDGRGTTRAERLSAGVKENTDQRIAIFTIGFGSDVDGPLLEQLAGENHGLYRQILVDSNAEAEMRGFFEEFATPLLFNINVQYEDDAVDRTSLTDENFISYFDGKELMVAGKLSEDYNGNDLKAVVTAKGNEQLELKTTKEIGQVDPNMIEDFAQRLWAYMKIKDLLAREKITLPNVEKQALKERALVLSLRYSFVTPLTSLLVIKPEDSEGADTGGTDQHVEVQADQPQSPPRRQPQPPPLPQLPPLPQPQLQFMRIQPLLPQPSRPVAYFSHAQPISYTIPSSSRLGGSVYGDPHILIRDAASDLKICFDIHGPNGTVVNLLYDPNLGITVNGEMVETETDQTRQKPDKTKPTYFQHIAIHVADDWVVASLEGIAINRDDPILWTSIVNVEVGSCTLKVRNGTTAAITCANGVVMNVSRQAARDNVVEHLDFHLVRGGVFTSSVNGIVGQFQRRSMTLIESPKRDHPKTGKEKAELVLDGQEPITVFKVNRNRVGTCWTNYAHQGLPMLEMSYLKYISRGGLFDQPEYELN